MRSTVKSKLTTTASRTVAVLTLVLGSLVASSGLVGAHEQEAVVSGPGVGLGAVVALTVVLGVVGGVAVVAWQRRRSRTAGHVSIPGIALVLVVLGCWAAYLALLRGPAVAALGIAVGAVATWTLRNRGHGGHRGCDEAALGAVVTHRFLEGALLATLYAAGAAIGFGGALVLGAHAAAETGAVAGLWSVGGTRGGWLVVAVVQGVFVAGALVGGLVAQSLTPLTYGAVLALLGGALVAAGVATGARRRDVAPAQTSAGGG